MGHVGLYKLHVQEMCPSTWWTEIYSYQSHHKHISDNQTLEYMYMFRIYVYVIPHGEYECDIHRAGVV